MANSILARIGVDTTSAKSELLSFRKSLVKLDKQVGNALKAGAFAAGAGFAFAAKEGIQLAAAAREVDAKFNTVFGTLQGGVNNQLAALKDIIPATHDELQGMAAALQDLLVPLGMAPDSAAKMSVDIVKLTGDLASFNNLPTADVMADIQSGLVGQYKPLLKYGVALSAGLVKQEAFNRGIGDGKRELTANERAQVSYQLILERTTAAQGDAERTAGSAANQFKFLTRDAKNLAAELGETLMPAALRGVKALDELAKGRTLGAIVNAESIGEAVTILGMKLQITALKFIGWMKDGLADIGDTAVAEMLVRLQGGVSRVIQGLMTSVQMRFEGMVDAVYVKIAKASHLYDKQAVDALEKAADIRQKQIKAEGDRVQAEIQRDTDLFIERMRQLPKTARNTGEELARPVQAVLDAMIAEIDTRIAAAKTEQEMANLEAARQKLIDAGQQTGDAIESGAEAAARFLREGAEAVREAGKSYADAVERVNAANRERYLAEADREAAIAARMESTGESRSQAEANIDALARQKASREKRGTKEKKSKGGLGGGTTIISGGGEGGALLAGIDAATLRKIASAYELAGMTPEERRRRGFSRNMSAPDEFYRSLARTIQEGRLFGFAGKDQGDNYDPANHTTAENTGRIVTILQGLERATTSSVGSTNG